MLWGRECLAMGTYNSVKAFEDSLEFAVYYGLAEGKKEMQAAAGIWSGEQARKVTSDLSSSSDAWIIGSVYLDKMNLNKHGKGEDLHPDQAKYDIFTQGTQTAWYYSPEESTKAAILEGIHKVLGGV